MGTSRLRRLTADQYANTVRDLIGVTIQADEALTADEEVGPRSTAMPSPR